MDLFRQFRELIPRLKTRNLLRRALRERTGKAERDLVSGADPTHESDVAWIEQAEAILSAGRRSLNSLMDGALRVVAVILTAVLMYAVLTRVEEASVEAEITTRAFSADVLDPVTVSELQGLHRITFADAGQTVEQPPVRGAAMGAIVRQTTLPLSSTSRSITTGAFIADGPLQMMIEARPDERQYWFRLAGEAPGQIPAVSLVLPQDAQPAGVPPAQSYSGKTIYIRPSNALALTVSPPVPFLKGPNWPLRIGKISFLSPDLPTSMAKARRLISAIEKGSIRFDGMRDSQISIRYGEHLTIDRLARGYISGITFNSESMVLRMEADVQGLTSHYGNKQQSLMPRKLEQWRAHGEASLFFVSCAAVLSTAGTFLKWTRGGES